MNDVSDLRSTIIPKSDQLNADQLLGGPMTITISAVKIGATADQPIALHYEDDQGRPYKPCKTMRKVLVFAWGPDGRAWAGRSMTLYNDPAVKFGGESVGGIRISNMTDIERDLSVSLTSTKGKKALYRVERMDRPSGAKRTERPPRTPRHDGMVADFELVAREQGLEAFVAAWKRLPQEDRAAIGIAERDRIAGLAPKTTESTTEGQF